MKKKIVGSNSVSRALTTTTAHFPRWCHQLLETGDDLHMSAYHSRGSQVFLQMHCYWRAQWFILLTGSEGFLWVVRFRETVLVLGWVCSWEVSVEDAVTSWSASFTGESTAHVILSGVAGVRVDVCRVSSVFAFLDIAGAITVDNSWERETALSETWQLTLSEHRRLRIII